MKFVDHLTLSVHAGRGGDGCVSFHREKYAPHGGPDGGDGGRGGSVFAEADPHLMTLYDLKSMAHVRATNGLHGGGNNRAGRSGEDRTVLVPLGTILTDTETGEELGDLTEPGERLCLAQGGKGGLGNPHFATSRMRTPRKATEGKEGEVRRVTLELKIIADVGLVGLPNAGKSTLLAALTRADPKIASYPFTTLHPNLGVMALPDFAHCTVADIPGLIEGAHRGQGLGDRFLRHIERTRLLVHLVPVDADEGHEAEALWCQFELVNAELAAHSDTLAARPQMVVISKIDETIPEQLDEIRAHFAARGVETLALSSAEGEGLEALRTEIDTRLAALREAEAQAEAAESETAEEVTE